MEKAFYKYLRPTTPAEACSLKAGYGGDASFLAGGTDLVVKMKAGLIAPNCCIDISFIRDFDYIRCDRESIYIGSLTRVATLIESKDVTRLIPVLSEAANCLGSPQIRNMATVGGNLCNASPCADLAVCLLALDAKLKLISAHGERWVALKNFYRENGKPNDISQERKPIILNEDELLGEIKIPTPSSDTQFAFLKLRRAAVDLAIVNMGLSIQLDHHGIISDVKIVLGSVAPIPMRSKKAESMLLGVNMSEIDNVMMEKVGGKAAEEIRPITDVRATAKYRRIISSVMVKQGIEKVSQNFGAGKI